MNYISRSRLSPLLAAALLALLVTACSDAPNSQQTIAVSVLPDQGQEALRRRHIPLIEYLSETTGLKLELIFYDDYESFVSAFHEDSVDLAWFGGLTFVREANHGHAEPLIMRDIDNRFFSHFIIRSDEPGQSLEDFRNRHIAFGSRLSTSGHLMPRHTLRERGMLVNEFFASVRHAATHDETVRWVLEGEVDIGAVNSVILRNMIQDGRLEESQIRVLEITPTYANYVWVVNSRLPEAAKRALRDAFLALDPVEPDHRRILELQGAGGYIPAIESDFAATREVADSLGLLAN